MLFRSVAAFPLSLIYIGSSTAFDAIIALTGIACPFPTSARFFSSCSRRSKGKSRWARGRWAAGCPRQRLQSGASPFCGHLDAVPGRVASDGHKHELRGACVFGDFDWRADGLGDQWAQTIPGACCAVVAGAGLNQIRGARGRDPADGVSRFGLWAQNIGEIPCKHWLGNPREGLEGRSRAQPLAISALAGT